MVFLLNKRFGNHSQIYKLILPGNLHCVFQLSLSYLVKLFRNLHLLYILLINFRYSILRHFPNLIYLGISL